MFLFIIQYEQRFSLSFLLKFNNKNIAEFQSYLDFYILHCVVVKKIRFLDVYKITICLSTIIMLQRLNTQIYTITMKQLKNMFVPIESSAKDVIDTEIQNGLREVSPFKVQDTLASNQVFTSKYTWITFLPLNLIQQFSKPPNLYFLMIGLLQIIPVISSTRGIPTMYIPLGIIICITALKDLYEDNQRSISDKIENNRQYQKIDEEGNACNILSKQIKVGMVIKIKKNQIIPCDGLLLEINETNKYAFVSTSNLDGEMHLKRRTVQKCLKNNNQSNKFNHNFHAHCQKPTPDFHQFSGSINCGSSVFSIDENNICLRGTKLRNTQYIILLVLYTGRQTKVLLNMTTPHAKHSNIQKRLKILIFAIFIVIIVLSASFAILKECYYHKKQVQTIRSPFKRFVIGFFSWILNLTNLIPISLLVTLESVSLIQGKVISKDSQMKTNSFQPLVNTSNIVEDLGAITCVASDKTGTLTKNQLKVRKISDGTKSYNDEDQIPKPLLQLFGICHNGYVSEGQFQSVSQDEVAILQFCNQKGVRLNDRTQLSMQIKSDQNDICVSILHHIQFTSQRRRQSLIFDRDGRTFIVTKGSDCELEKLSINNPKKNIILDHVLQFANLGLRTMVLGIKEIQRRQISAWMQKLILAKNHNDKEEIKHLEQDIQRNLQIIGAVGIQDELQDQVFETVEMIINAGIQFIIISGDRPETVMSIARNLKVNDEPFLCPYNEYMPEYCKQKFLVFARCTPKDKRNIVKQMPRNVLAIGDGANDVAMITAATFGVGIAGKQGRAAAQSSDIAISEFKHLKKLLFYYGRQTYRKNSFLVLYNFYKNIIYTMPQIIFGAYSYYTGVSIYEPYLAQFYNTIFTSAPIFLYALFDRVQSQSDLLSNKNHLYTSSRQQQFFNVKSIAFMIIQSVIVGSVSTIVGFSLLSGMHPSPEDLSIYQISSIMMFYVIIYVNFKVISVQSQMNLSILITGLGGIASYIIFFNVMLLVGGLQSQTVQIFFTSQSLLVVSCMLLVSAMVTYLVKTIQKIKINKGIQQEQELQPGMITMMDLIEN